MIAARKVAPKQDFESLLERSRIDLETTLQVGQTLSNREFEIAVLNAMRKNAKGTAFDGEIKETGDREFPDLIISGYYGVEVKQTTKARFVTSGNSIFEQARHEEAEDIYVMMAKTGGGVEVQWKPYAECLSGVIITHSPRYSISLEDGATSVFKRIGADYDEFRRLPQEEKMKLVRKLYTGDDKTGRKLWWLSTADKKAYRLFRDCSKKKREELVAAMMFTCPEVFGGSRDKFQGSVIYALSRGVIIPNIRDPFSAGGQVIINGKSYPQIFSRAVDLRDLIWEFCQDADTDILSQFWGVPVVPEDPQDRWQAWIDVANRHAHPDKISAIL